MQRLMRRNEFVVGQSWNDTPSERVSFDII